MTAPETEKPAAKCPVEMHDGSPCGRHVYHKGLCICHSDIPEKNSDRFKREIEAMLARKDYDFTRFVFPNAAEFTSRVFDGSVRFRGATFQGEAQFAGARFQREAEFRWATFCASACFALATFESGADFPDATFMGDADFGRATFAGPASFSSAKLQGKAYFTWGTFEGDTHFPDATFHGYAGFLGATFRGHTDLSGAAFQDRADFQDAKFRGKARFRGTRFQGKADFFRATFEDATEFVYATFLDAALFVGERDNRLFCRQADADFYEARFEHPERAVFRHVYLGKARFLGADVRRVDFTKVQWGTRLDGRPAVWDELGPEEDGKEKDYALIGKLYRQLKYNYEEEQRDPITAGDFHFGEMEMRRLEPCKGWLRATYRRYLSAIAFYRWISGYGEDYVRAFAWIVVMILLFGVVFTHPWFALRTSPLSGSLQPVNGFWPHLLYSVMCFLLRGDKPFEPVHLAGHYASVAEGIIGPPLIAMFVLALNRRFKR
ncbi:MAG TPA: pentapeptide repeat-containing protein [Armatimonadota bacterium]|nr:pentapeptide repeat-containing protein [Armatimonadota bacterium]